ncbi:MAG: hypothetical protein AAF849_21290 [Bacteroidota bacterium]
MELQKELSLFAKSSFCNQSSANKNYDFIIINLIIDGDRGEFEGQKRVFLKPFFLPHPLFAAVEDGGR